MKKFFILFLLAISVLCLISCNTSETSDTDASGSVSGTEADVTEPQLLNIITDGASDYAIVRGDRATSWETRCASDLVMGIKEKTGVLLDIQTDWKGENISEREIIVGTTNREDNFFTVDRDAIGRGGYIIKVCDERIVIVGKDSSGLSAAIEHFLSLIPDTPAGEESNFSIDKEFLYMTEKEEGAFADTEKINYADVKAMWLSQFDFTSIYTSSGKQRAESDFTARIENALDNCVSIGINTVIVQVRPNADSFYPSDYYAPSKYVVGAYGNDFDYDPFAILIEKAHERNLSVHAWINPMRAMSSSEIGNIPSSYPIAKWWNDASLKSKYLPVVNGGVYLNVGYAEVRQLIVDGACEILENYNVDGLHMDDYFYPTTDSSFDKSAYSENGGSKSLSDFRRDCLNALVSDLYSAVKAINPDILFGISPAGTMEKDYDTLYADIYTWCGKDGYIDYICPQIYFGMEHATCAFDMLTDKWNNIIKTDNVKMWIGMTLGKAVSGAQGTEDKWAGSGKREWINNKDVLLRCLEYTKKATRCVGVSYFCYQYFWNPTTGAVNTNTSAERANFLPLLKSISWSEG